MAGKTNNFMADRRSFIATSVGAAALSSTEAYAAPIDEPADLGVSVKRYGAKGDGVADDTAAIQAALDKHLQVFIPPGTYKTTAMLKIRGFQIVRGAGSERSLIKNDRTDCFGKDDIVMPNGNFFQISGIGCVKTFDKKSRTKAFNLSNTSFVKCDDVAATNFYTAIYMARDYTNFDAEGNCWSLHLTT